MTIKDLRSRCGAKQGSFQAISIRELDTIITGYRSEDLTEVFAEPELQGVQNAHGTTGRLIGRSEYKLITCFTFSKDKQRFALFTSADNRIKLPMAEGDTRAHVFWAFFNGSSELRLGQDNTFFFLFLTFTSIRE